MSIANGVKNQKLRKELTRNHREAYLLLAANRMFDNPTTENGKYLRMRADKVKAIRRG